MSEETHAHETKSAQRNAIQETYVFCTMCVSVTCDDMIGRQKFVGSTHFQVSLSLSLSLPLSPSPCLFRLLPFSLALSRVRALSLSLPLSQNEFARTTRKSIPERAKAVFLHIHLSHTKSPTHAT